MTPNGAQERFPAMIEEKSRGGNALAAHPAFPMPYTLLWEDGTGLAVQFPIAAAGLGWNPKNQQPNCLRNHQELEALRLSLRVDAHPIRVMDAVLTPLQNGWPEGFEGFRKMIRRNLDLSQQQREDLAWARDCMVYHFAFAYGKECFDYDTGRFNMTRLLDDGEACGGYDAVLIWHQYPRLGLDSRDQWDFFEDFPGGISALREAVDTAHKRGVRVLLPFKPWDRLPSKSDVDIAEALKEVLRQTDADGVFLDATQTAPTLFREAMDQVRPGLILDIELTPQDQGPIELVTSTWDQYFYEWGMPEAPLFRYLFPEYSVHMTSRWALGEGKDNLIKRAMFNGCGLVVWQDVFGTWLPFSQEQKAAIRQWKQVYREWRDCFRGRATPLWPTVQKGLQMNLFEGENRAVAAFYNDAGQVISGEAVRRLNYSSARAILGGTASLSGGTLSVAIEPGEVLLAVLER